MRTSSLQTAFLLVVTLAMAASAAAQSNSQSAPGAAPAAGAAAAAAVTPPADYVIGPEDVLAIDVWKEPDVSGEARVMPDGSVNLKGVGAMSAAGLRLEDFEKQVQTAVSKWVKEPTVTVTVRELNSRKVYITGEVNNPNAYSLTGPRTVMQLITLAGGLTEFASKDRITITREVNGKTVQYRFNYKEFAAGKKLEQNIQLRPGDIVTVPD